MKKEPTRKDGKKGEPVGGRDYSMRSSGGGKQILVRHQREIKTLEKGLLYWEGGWGRDRRCRKGAKEEKGGGYKRPRKIAYAMR